MDNNFERIKPPQDLDANVSSDDEPLITKFRKTKKEKEKRNSNVLILTYEKSNIQDDDIIDIDSDNDDKKEDPDYIPDYVPDPDENKIDSPIEILEEEDLREEIKELNSTN